MFFRSHSSARTLVLTRFALFSSQVKRQWSRANSYYLVAKDEMEQFMFRCMRQAGAKSEHARSLAACLVLADYRGHFSHGLNRLGNWQLWPLHSDAGMKNLGLVYGLDHLVKRIHLFCYFLNRSLFESDYRIFSIIRPYVYKAMA